MLLRLAQNSSWLEGKALSHVGQRQTGPMRGVAGEPIAGAHQAASLTERLQSCTAKGTRLLETGKLVSPLSHAFSFASLACKYQYRSREGAAAQGTCTWSARRSVINTSSRVACQPRPQGAGTLGSWGMLASTKQAIRPVLIYCIGCSLLRFCFLPFSSHTSSHPLLFLFI